MSGRAEELAKTRIFDFTARGGVRIVDGKAYYPAFVNLSLGREDAIDLAAKLLGAFQATRERGAEDVVEVTLVGELREEPEEPEEPGEATGDP